MHDVLEALNRFFAALPAWLRQRRLVVWSVAIAPEHRWWAQREQGFRA